MQGGEAGERRQVGDRGHAAVEALQGGGAGERRQVGDRGHAAGEALQAGETGDLIGDALQAADPEVEGPTRLPGRDPGFRLAIDLFPDDFGRNFFRHISGNRV